MVSIILFFIKSILKKSYSVYLSLVRGLKIDNAGCVLVSTGYIYIAENQYLFNIFV